MARAQDNRNVIPQIAFNAGEVSANLRGRIDLQKFQQGVEELTNFLVLPQGPITRRMGTIHQATLGVVGESVPYEDAPDPEWIDPWNFHYIDASLTMNSGDDETLDFKLWSNEGTSIPADPDASGVHDVTWSNTNTGSTTVPWGNYDDGAVTLASNVDWTPTTDDFITLDLGHEFRVEKLWFSFDSNANADAGDPPSTHGIHTAVMYYAPESERADGEDYVDANITWTTGETIDFTTDWNSSSNGAYDSIQKDLATPVTLRYLKLKITDDWLSNGDASNPRVRLSKMLLYAQITQAYMDTIELTTPRYSSTTSAYRSFGATDWTFTDLTGLSGGGSPDYTGTNQMSDAVNGYADSWTSPNNLDENEWELMLYTFNGTAKLLSRLTFIGEWLNIGESPSKIKLYYKQVTASGFDSDWTLHRTWRFPSMNDASSYGANGEDFATWQQSLFGGSNQLNKAWQIPVPQAWYWAFKFVVSTPIGDTGNGSQPWKIATILHQNRFVTADTEDTTPPYTATNADDVFAGVGAIWGRSQDAGSTTWTAESSTGFDNFTGTSDGSSRAIYRHNVDSFLENRDIRVTFDITTNTTVSSEFYMTVIEESDAGGSSGTVWPTASNVTGGTAYLNANYIWVPSGETGTYTVDFSFGAQTLTYAYFMMVVNESGKQVVVENFSVEYID